MKQKMTLTVKTLGILVIANVLGNLISESIKRKFRRNTIAELEELDDGYDDSENDFTEGE
jgi:hypothetical protein